MTKIVLPSTNQTAFNCPHCHALTTQYWHVTYARQITGDNPVPLVWGPEKLERAEVLIKDERDPDVRKQLSARLEHARKLALGTPEFGDRVDAYVHELSNVWISSCYNCKRLALWLHEALVYPIQNEVAPPNEDMSEEVRRDYLEASQILRQSPRGAAALLRLAIQKLCMEFGCKGKKIDDDIADLVAKGLDQRVQMMLDSVRVIGNNAVHPGQMDLRDSRDTAEAIFGLINLIVDKMISEKKKIEAVYSALPQGALDAIAKRDKSKP